MRTETSRLLALLAALALAPAGLAQNPVPVISISWQSPTVGLADSQFGLPITEGDLLVGPAPTLAPQFGPAPTPAILAKAGPHPGIAPPHLGLAFHPACAGHPGGTPCAVEVDAICNGRAQFLQPALMTRHLYFSVDKFAAGMGLPLPPSISSEFPIGESAADVFVNLMTGPGPLGPGGGPLQGSTAAVDGDGLQGASAFRYRGMGLQEPTLPGPMLPATGDELDALTSWNLTTTAVWPQFGLFFSLDGALVDPYTGIPGSNSAVAHGFRPGDVLVTLAPNLAPVLYAPAPLLGLDLMGLNSDDLDALVICENGVPGYQRAPAPYGWLQGPDLLLFSVRRGSAVIGMPDSIFGIPISEGDVLVPPVLGGLSPFPGIFIAAENLGLSTLRAGPGLRNDDLDALELPNAPFFDCNGNGVEDALDIRLFGAADLNNDGIPDVCQTPMNYAQFCFCPNALAPCGNGDATAGCANSTGVGALITPTGSTSVGLDDLVLTTTQLPTFKQLLLMVSANIVAPLPFYDGRRCLVSPISRIGPKNSGPLGNVSFGPGLSAYSIANFPAVNWILPGTTFGFQTWYRDPTGPCGSGANVSSAVAASFVP